MKLCINCDAENSDEAVFCSECGMSLMAAPTGEQAIKLAEERRAKRREEARRRLEQPLTASGIVYLFGDQFVTPGASEAETWAVNITKAGLAVALQTPALFVPEPGAVRVPYSGQQVRATDLGRKLLEAAFISLAQEGYILLGVEKIKTLFLSREAVTISQERSGDELPPSLERSVTDALACAPQKRWLRTLVAALGKQRIYYEKVHDCVVVADIVADALMAMNWLQRGVVHGESVHGKPTEEAVPLLAAMAGEAETVKARLENFAIVDPHLHARLVSELMQLA